MKSVWTLAIIAAAIGNSTSHADISVHWEPKEPLMDEVVQIRVSGLKPGAECTIRSRATIGPRVALGRATFKADENGSIDVAKQASIKGSYVGVDPMGLFWSMEFQTETVPATALKVTDPRITILDVECDGQIVAKSEVKRWLVRPNVRITDVRENGLVGKLFEPSDGGKKPGLLVLSGSEGGISENEAALLASHGYVALALAYFGVEGLPKQLVEIPLEYLKKGVAYLAARESVDATRLGVVGGSKGGELSLLLAAHTPELRVVVARAPSHVAWFALGGNYRQSSWTLDGKPIPFLQASALSFPKVLAANPIRFVELYGPAIDDAKAVQPALIPVEKINGAVMVLSGTDDAMWPAARMADTVAARLKEHKHRFPVEHLKYEGAGHAIVSTYIPMQATIVSGRLAMGGNPAANAKAMADSRPKVLRFLKENLK